MNGLNKSNAQTETREEVKREAMPSQMFTQRVKCTLVYFWQEAAADKFKSM